MYVLLYMYFVNMIYLIGGTAKSGKTYLAKKILEENNISYFSTDYLMIALSQIEALDISVDTEDDRSVAKKLSPYLQSMIEAMVYNRIDYLIEGVHITPSLVYTLIKKYPDKIKACFLGYTELSYQEKKADLINHQSRMENCWYKHYSDENMNQLASFLIDYSKALKNECQALDLTYIEVKDITKQVYGMIDDLI